jgi:hypothetical protein
MVWLAVFGIAKRIGAWLTSLSFWQIMCLGLALFAGAQTIRVSAEKRHSAKVETQLSKCAATRHADQEAYRKAQADAQAKNRQHVAEIERQYQRNNDEAVATLNARLERLRRELSNAAPQSHPNGASPPKADDPEGASGETRVCIAAKDFLRAAENEERFDELITLILKQTEIDPNK